MCHESERGKQLAYDVSPINELSQFSSKFEALSRDVVEHQSKFPHDMIPLGELAEGISQTPESECDTKELTGQPTIQPSIHPSVRSVIQPAK